MLFCSLGIYVYGSLCLEHFLLFQLLCFTYFRFQIKGYFPRKKKKRAFPDSPNWLYFRNSYLFCVFMESRCFSFHVHIINFNTLLNRVCIKTLLSHALLYPQCLPQKKHSPNPCCISKQQPHHNVNIL